MYGIHRQSFFLNDLKFIHLKIDSKKNNYLKIDSKKNNYLNLMIYVNLKQILKLKNLNSTIVYLLTLNASSKPKLYRSQSKRSYR